MAGSSYPQLLKQIYMASFSILTRTGGTMSPQTEPWEMLKAEAYVEALNKVTDGVVITDEAGSVYFKNAVVSQLLGDDDDLVGHVLWGKERLWSALNTNFEWHEEGPIALARKGRFERDFYVLRHSQREYYLATFSGYPLQKDKRDAPLLVFVINDIRKLKWQETE
jgi:hypothetical protein